MSYATLFSARKMRTRRGFGARGSWYSSIAATVRPKLGKRRADLVQSRRMRIVGLVLLVLSRRVRLQEQGQDADAAPDPAALKAQQELIARRDKLLEARKKLQASATSSTPRSRRSRPRAATRASSQKKRAELDTQLET